MTEKYKLIDSLLATSFQIFLTHSNLLSDDTFNQMMIEQGPGKPINITPPDEVTACEWSICAELDPPSDHPADFYLRGYELAINYRYNDRLVFQSLYSLIKDIKRNQLHYTRNFTRIIERATDGELIPHLVSYGDESITAVAIVSK